MKVYIMRGLPGAGKSSWVKTNLENAVVCSADAFHVQNDGVYRFDPAKVGLAHGECLQKFVRNLAPIGIVDILVVDNTNTTAVEMAPYVRLCEAFGVEYEIVWVMASPETAFRRGVHDVPFETVQRMYQNLMTERLPAGWVQRCVLPPPEGGYKI